MTCIDCNAEDADCLTGDRDRVCADCLYERVVRQRDDLLAEVGRLKAEVEGLTADPLPAAAWVREVERAAFQRGAEAMRAAAVEVASKRANLQRLTDSDCAWVRSAECIRDELRHLSVPEDVE